jgi:hypothetical protein
MTSRPVPGFHDEDPGPAAHPWRPGPRERLSASRAGSAATRWHRVRQAAAAGLASGFIVLLPVAVTSVWIRGTVLSTSGYVAAVSSVAASPAVRAVVREAVTDEANAVLPRARGALAGPLRTGLVDLAGKETSAFMASPAFQRLWAEANQVAQAQLISVLNGNSTLVSATGGRVALNLIPLANDVCSPARIQIPLFQAAALAGPRHVYRTVTAANWLVLVLTPLAFASALGASPRRRRTLLHMATGGTLTLILAMTVLSWLQSSLTARADPRYQAVTSAVLHALTSNFFTLTRWCVAGSLALAVVTLLSGPYRWATATRAALRNGAMTRGQALLKRLPGDCRRLTPGE